MTEGFDASHGSDRSAPDQEWPGVRAGSGHPSPSAAYGPPEPAAPDHPAPHAWGPPPAPPRAGRAPVRFPAERPDFEPPAGWVPGRPGPAPWTSGWPAAAAGGAEDTAGSGPVRWGRGLSLGLAITLTVVVAAFGAVIGSLATLHYADRPPAEVGTALGPAPVAPAPPRSGGGEALPKPGNVASVAAALLPSVVQVKVKIPNGRVTGSGLVLNTRGHILTNNHVVDPAAGSGAIRVVFRSGHEESATVVGRSAAYDLAVLRVAGGASLTPAALGDSDGVVVGEPVVAIGSPLDLAGTVTSGIVSARDRPVSVGENGDTSFIDAIQTDAAINPGNSGGPLANLRAEVIGVNSAIATVHQRSMFSDEPGGSIGLGFAVPINQARRTARQIIRTGHAVYPVLGATVDLGYDGPGARIVRVQPGSGAENRGLRSGDLVTVIDGHPVTGADDLIVQVRRHRPGQRVDLTYRRDGAEDRVVVTLGRQVG